MDGGREEVRRDRESGGLPGEEGRGKLGAGLGGERNWGKNCSSWMVRSWGLRGGHCFFC